MIGVVFVSMFVLDVVRKTEGTSRSSICVTVVLSRVLSFGKTVVFETPGGRGSVAAKPTGQPSTGPDGRAKPRSSLDRNVYLTVGHAIGTCVLSVCGCCGTLVHAFQVCLSVFRCFRCSGPCILGVFGAVVLGFPHSSRVSGVESRGLIVVLWSMHFKCA